MREFTKYMHVERFGNDEVNGIEFGKCYIFPKIDGTNGSVWIDKNDIKAGSRNHELSAEKDNAGFYKEIINSESIAKCLMDNPSWYIFGEWLVPHSLKTYREDAWRKFYIFDVMENGSYIPYDIYGPILNDYGLDFIDPLCIINNPAYETLLKWTEKNNFLIDDGIGEGVVIKNYDFYNKYHRQVWAKIVRSEFKEKHRREMGAPEMDGKKMIEEDFCLLCTDALIKKTYEKIRNENDGWSSRLIPRLLSTVFHDFVNEETWNFIKKNKNPSVNFRTLQTLITVKIKNVMTELF